MPHPLDILQRWFVGTVAADRPDLTARQMAVLLTVYRTDGPHTVRGLARAMNVSKPAITRALDRLGELDLAVRKIDPQDRRSVIVQRTTRGAATLRALEAHWRTCERDAAQQPPTAPATQETPAHASV